MPSRGFQPLRDLPTLVWLLLLVAGTIGHRWLPVAAWLMLHLLFLGAATHAILVWSQHFTAALTRSPHTVSSRRAQNIRLALANLGTVLVLIGVPSSVWPITIAGAALIIVAVIWHGISIARRLRGALPGRFTRTVRYYVVSAAFLPIGAALGAWLAGGPDVTGDSGDTATRLVLAHAVINVLGWIGITVAGTLVTLWPTMLRTKADDRASDHAARALPVLAAAVLVAAIGAAVGLAPLMTLGFAGYAAGLGIIAVSLLSAARRTAPRSFATMSATAALSWWIACLAVLAVQSARASFVQFAGTGAGGAGGGDIGGIGGIGDIGGIALVQQAVDWAAPYLAAGFVAQILAAALSYLVPVSLGGGPSPVRIGTATLDTGGTIRVATANVALFVCALPVTSVARVAASVLYLIAMASFLWFLIVALRRQGRAKRADGGSGPGSGSAPAPTPVPAPASAPAPTPGRRGPITVEGALPAARRAGQAVAGLLAVTLVVAISYAIDPHSLGPVPSNSTASGAASGQDDSAAPVQTFEVTAADMSFSPSEIEVPIGTRLVIELTNADPELVHDLMFENGAGSSRLAPGESATIDVGVITGDLAGWCTIVGHRQMGMTLDVIATGSAADASGEAGSGSHEHHTGGSAAGESAAGLVDLMQEPAEGFEPYDAVLDPLPASDGPTTHRITMPVTEQVTEVAPGVRQNLWTFGGTAPGPLLHGRVGDTFEITLENDGTIGHSIDFHAGALAPDEPMRTIQPGESLTYTFTATRSGIWMYHCATMPMSAHIANGMYGAVIIEPDGLPSVDRSYAFVQGEFYLGPQDGEIDMERLMSGVPDLVVFNGYASQYRYAPLPAKAGERVRIWVLDAGPDRASSFHVVGGQFDTVWTEGRYLVNRATDTGSQALALQPAQGGFVELVFPEAGHYPFVSHLMTDAERGAGGVFAVE